MLSSILFLLYNFVDLPSRQLLKAYLRRPCNEIEVSEVERDICQFYWTKYIVI